MASTDSRNFLEGVPKVWASIQPSFVPRRAIVTRREYQPRDPAVISGNHERFRHQRVLEASVKQMVDLLRASPENQTDPVWLVELEGALVLVDGHHRLNAYAQCRRTKLPAKVYRGRNAQKLAAFSSRLANVQGSRIQLHPDEIREAVWQTLRELTANGSRSWEEVSDSGRRYSLRFLQSQFGGQPSIGTLSNMCKHLPRVRRDLSRGGGWPSWRQLLAALRKEHAKPPSDFDREEQVGRLADRLVKLLERHDADIRRDAYLRAEEILGELQEAELRELGIQLDPGDCSGF